MLKLDSVHCVESGSLKMSRNRDSEDIEGIELKATVVAKVYFIVDKVCTFAAKVQDITSRMLCRQG